MKKGQLTVFILIGIFVILIFGLMFYVGLKTPVRTAPELEDNIRNYVQACLNTALTDGLYRAGKQGLHLQVDLESQCQNIPCPPMQQQALSYSIEPIFVPYLIRMQEDDSSKISHSEESQEQYLWKGFPYLFNGKQISDIKLNNPFLSATQMLPLYKSQSSLSLQAQLERHIEKVVQQCATFEEFEYLNITTDSPTAEVVINTDREFAKEYTVEDEEVVVLLNWTVDVKAFGANAIISEYSARSAVRLSKIYYYVRSNLLDESIDGRFQLEDVEGFTIQKNFNGQDDLITFVDINSRIEGKPYEIQFLRQNRRPALFAVNAPDDNTINVCLPAKVTVDESEDGSKILLVPVESAEDDKCKSKSIPKQINHELYSKTFKTIDLDGDEVSICVALGDQKPVLIEQLDAQITSPTHITIYACDNGCSEAFKWYDSNLCSYQTIKVLSE